MARPKRTLLDEIRTRAWVVAVLKISGLDVPEVERRLEDNSKAWYKYRNGEHAPNKGLINRVEKEWPCTKRVFLDGPANLFAAATTMGLEQGYWLFKSSRLEPRYLGVLPRFLDETQFRGPSEQCLIALADWLRLKARTEAAILPLAVSANLVTAMILGSDGLWEVIVPGAKAFDEQYGLPSTDFLRVNERLLATFVGQSKRDRLPIPQWALDEDAKAAFGGFPDLRAKGIR